MKWFRRKSSEPPRPAFDHDRGAITSPLDIRICYSNANGKQEERFNLIDVAAAAIEKHGHKITRHADRFTHDESGLVFVPKVEGFKTLDSSGAQTITIIQITHPRLIPEGVFEFQHSTGKSGQESFASGFDQWAQTDLVVFLDALRAKPAKCMMMEMTFPEKDGATSRMRRAILGPVAHMMLNRDKARPTSAGEKEAHPFCPCCLLTHLKETVRPVLESDQFTAIRMFAVRDQNGQPGADCRVNGEEWEEGKAALRQYVETWPDLGFEFRKQYVVIHTMPAGQAGAT